MTLKRSGLRTIQVLYENVHLVVFSKPAGLLTIPAKGEEKTLSSLVNEHYTDQSDDSQQANLYPCHRLDRDTSGAIIYAKGKKWQKLIMENFHKHLVTKRYIVFVHGVLRNKRGTIDRSIRDLEDTKRQKQKLYSVTKYTVLEQRKDFAIVEAEPVTGRTNQIRIHFQMFGHPVIGERKYSRGKDFELKFKRTALHSSFLSWRDPESNKKINVKCELPSDMQAFLEKHKT